MNEIDILMDLDPEEMTPAERKALIAQYRKRRMDYESGVKSPKGEGKVSLDGVLSSLVKSASPPAPTIKRRV